jgi:type I restriction enzyme M protein
LTKTKPEHLKGKVLFVYARNLFKAISRRQVVFTDEHIAKIVEKFRLFENALLEDKVNEVGFTKVVTLDEIAKNDYVLMPERYVGVKEDEDETSFEEKMRAYSEELLQLIKKDEELTKKIKEVFSALDSGV